MKKQPRVPPLDRTACLLCQGTMLPSGTVTEFDSTGRTQEFT